MSDLLERTFATFANEARDEIRPPGAASARRMSQRRHKRRIVASAIAVVTVAAGVALAVGTMPGESVQPSTVSPDAGARPYSTARLEALRLHALDELVKMPPDGRPSSPIFVDSLATTSAEIRRDGPALAAGKFTLEMQCYGVGVVHYRWTIGARTISNDMGCVDSTTAAQMSRWLQTDDSAHGPSSVDFTPNDQCLGRCAIAYRLVPGWDSEWPPSVNVPGG